MFRKEDEVSQAGIRKLWCNLLYAAGEASTETCVCFSLSSEEVVRLKGFERRNNMTVPSLYAVGIAAMNGLSITECSYLLTLVLITTH